MPKADRIWEPLPCDDAAVARLTRDLNVSPLTARLLCIRGLGDPDGALLLAATSRDCASPEEAQSECELILATALRD